MKGKQEKEMTALRQYEDTCEMEYVAYKSPVAAPVDAKAFEPNPSKKPASVALLQAKIMRRYSETIAYLAK